MIDPYPDPDPVAPARWEADVIVSDGGTVHLRPIRPDDAEALVAFHSGLSQRTRYLRYFSAYPRIPERDLHRFTHVDHHYRVAFVALLAGEIIGVGRYEGTPGSDEAEVAFVVADSQQGRGIGSVLLEHLAAAARESGITRFHAVVLAENTAMINVFKQAGYETTRSVEYGEVTLEFAVDETETTARVMREREQRAESRSIRRLLFPSSVAVVGASADEDKIGHAVFANLVRMGFTGALYPVNPGGGQILGHDVQAELPAEVDLVVVAVPAASVPDVVADCARRQVRGLVVVTGGFGERGEPAERAAGAAAQRDLVLTAHANGLRVIGPNCLGVINTDPGVRLNASLTPVAPPTGRVGFFCQSGALGVAVLGEATRRGLGVSTFVSAGNRADVSGNDLLQYWAGDEATDVALLYLESFGNPRKFTRVARSVARVKPIVAVKNGVGATSVPGLMSTSVALPDDAIRSLFEASGVIRVDTLGDMLDVALVLTSQPLPAGPRVAFVGNSTALGVLVANACLAAGLDLVRSIDVGVRGGADAFTAALEDVQADEEVDAVVVVFMPPLAPTGGDDVARAIRDAAGAGNKPVVATFLGFDGVPAALAGEGEGAPPPGSVPAFPTPERAVRSLARVVRYAQWRARPTGHLVHLDDVDLDRGRTVVARALATSRDGRELTGEEVGLLLGAVGIRLSAEIPVDAVEVVLGIREDPSFGALATFGVGGVVSELLGDRAFAPVPLTDVDAARLVRGPRALPLLTGYEGRVPADLGALEDLALRLSALSDALPELAYCRLDAYAGPVGAYVSGARAAVSPTRGRADSGPRRLPGL